MALHLCTLPEKGKPRMVFPVYVPSPYFVVPADPEHPFRDSPLSTGPGPRAMPVPPALIAAEAIRVYLESDPVDETPAPPGIGAVESADDELAEMGLCWSEDSYLNCMLELDDWFKAHRGGRGGVVLAMDEMQELYREADKAAVAQVYGQIYRALRFPRESKHCQMVFSGSSALFAATMRGGIDREELGLTLLREYPSVPNVSRPPHSHYVYFCGLAPLQSLADTAWMLRYGLESWKVHPAIKELTQDLRVSRGVDGEVTRSIPKRAVERQVEVDGIPVSLLDVYRRTGGVPRLLRKAAENPSLLIAPAQDAGKGRASVAPADEVAPAEKLRLIDMDKLKGDLQLFQYLYGAMAVVLTKQDRNVMQACAADPFGVGLSSLSVSLREVRRHLEFLAERDAKAASVLQPILASDAEFASMLRLWSDRGFVRFSGSVRGSAAFPTPVHALEAGQALMSLLDLPADAVQEMVLPTSVAAGRVGCTLAAASLNQRSSLGTYIGRALEQYGRPGPLEESEWLRVVEVVKASPLVWRGSDVEHRVASVSVVGDESVFPHLQWVVPTPDAGIDLLVLIPVEGSRVAIVLVVQVKLTAGSKAKNLTCAGLTKARIRLDEHYEKGKDTTKKAGGKKGADGTDERETPSVPVGDVVQRSLPPGTVVHRVNVAVTNKPIGPNSEYSSFESNKCASLVLDGKRMKEFWLDGMKVTAHWLDLDSYSGKLSNGELRSLISRLGTSGGAFTELFETFMTKEEAKQQAARKADEAARKADEQERARREAELEAAQKAFEQEHASVDALRGTGLQAHADKLARAGLTVDMMAHLSETEWSSTRDALLVAAGLDGAWGKVLDIARAKYQVADTATKPADQRGRPPKTPAAKAGPETKPPGRRGRPPKTPAAEAGPETKPPGRRGRPPKSLTAETTKQPGKRGRPRKAPGEDSTAAAAE